MSTCLRPLTHLVFGGCLLTSLASSAAVAGVCDSVINQRAFNTSDKRNVAQAYNYARSAMCNENWSEQNSFRQAANSLGISASYAEYAFGLNSSNSSSGGDYSAARSKYCGMSENEYNSYLALNEIQLIPRRLLRHGRNVSSYKAPDFGRKLMKVLTMITLYHFDTSRQCGCKAISSVLDQQARQCLLSRRKYAYND